MARRRDLGTERPAPIPIPDDQVLGRRFIRLLDGQLRQLRDHAQHGNRSFFYDQLVVAHLLAFFNPILAGLRKIEDVFDVPAVRKRLKLPRVPQSTLAAADRAAGVLTDTLVRVGWRDNRTALRQPLRLVEIAQPDQPAQPLRLLTNRLDLPAETVGVIYRQRWQIELFFRWLKCMANFKHFYSESPQGMTLQVYIALIGTLLIAIETGARPSSYDYALMSMAAAGLAPLDQILAQAAKRRAERRRAAEQQRARRAQKNRG